MCSGASSLQWRDMSVIASQINGKSTVCSTVRLGWGERNIKARAIDPLRWRPPTGDRWIYVINRQWHGRRFLANHDVIIEMCSMVSSLRLRHLSIMASNITANLTFCLTVCLAWHQRKLQSPCYWPFVRETHRWPVDSHHKWPVTWVALPCWSWRHHVLLRQCWVTRLSLISFSKCTINVQSSGMLQIYIKTLQR